MNKMSEQIKFIKSNHIYIYASELSNLIGMNKFKKPAEVLLRIWKTNFAEEHSCILKELQQAKKQVALDETKEETFQRIAKKYEDKTEKIKKEMEECKKTEDVVKMRESQQKMIDHCKDLEADDKVKIENVIREIAHTSFGTRQEKKSIHIYTKLTNTPVLELKYFCKRPLVENKTGVWFIGGKVDGVLQDKTVIEVKNRMRGLFNTVREYEKIQTYAYMFILHSQQSHLVETYFNGSRQECGILEVDFENEYWKNIVNRILIFANYFQKFRQDKNLQRQLIQKGTDKFTIDIF